MPSYRRRKVPPRGAFCTLLLPDESDELTVVPFSVYSFLAPNRTKDPEGWYDIWMLRPLYPLKSELSMTAALPERVEVWPSLDAAVAYIEKYKVDKPG